MACIRNALSSFGYVETYGEVIAVANGIERHTDEHCPRWSAFYVVHNDGCIVWGNRGMKLRPIEGQRFELDIHEMHGVSATLKKTQVFAAVYADGDTKKEAATKLSAILRDLSRRDD